MVKMTKKFGDIETVVQYQRNFNKDSQQDNMDIINATNIGQNTSSITAIKGNVTKLTNRVTELEKKGNSELTQDSLYNVLDSLLAEVIPTEFIDSQLLTQGRGVEIAKVIVQLLRTAMNENEEVKREMNLLVTSAQIM